MLLSIVNPWDVRVASVEPIGLAKQRGVKLAALTINPSEGITENPEVWPTASPVRIPSPWYKPGSSSSTPNFFRENDKSPFDHPQSKYDYWLVCGSIKYHVMEKWIIRFFSSVKLSEEASCSEKYRSEEHESDSRVNDNQPIRLPGHRKFRLKHQSDQGPLADTSQRDEDSPAANWDENHSSVSDVVEQLVHSR